MLIQSRPDSKPFQNKEMPTARKHFNNDAGTFDDLVSLGSVDQIAPGPGIGKSDDDGETIYVNNKQIFDNDMLDEMKSPTSTQINFKPDEKSRESHTTKNEISNEEKPAPKTMRSSPSKRRKQFVLDQIALNSSRNQSDGKGF